MSEKTTKIDPLLGDEEITKGEEQSVKPEVVPEIIKPVEKPVEIIKETIKPVGAVDIIEETKRILATKPQVNFIIPLSDGEAQGAYETVQINGYKLTIQKGAMVSIPLPVANLLAEKYKIAMEAGKTDRVDRTSDVSEALS